MVCLLLLLEPMVSLEIILKHEGDHHPITNSCQHRGLTVLPVNRTGPNSDLASFYRSAACLMLTPYYTREGEFH